MKYPLKLTVTKDLWINADDKVKYDSYVIRMIKLQKLFKIKKT